MGGRRKWGAHTAVRFTVDGHTEGVWSELPSWMFDRAACSVMRLSDDARVSWSALVELRKLLDETACRAPSLAVEDHQHCSSKSEGGADEERTSTPRTGATSIPRLRQRYQRRSVAGVATDAIWASASRPKVWALTASLRRSSSENLRRLPRSPARSTRFSSLR